MARRRVVITGLGVVSCLGNDVDQFYRQLLAGKSGIKKITTFPCEDYSTQIAGIIEAFDPGEYINPKLARRADPYITYALFAGKKAFEMAGCPQPGLDALRCGAIIGSGMGGMSIFVDGVTTLAERGHRRVSPFFIPYILPNMASGLLAKELGFMGPNYSVSSACATGNHAIIAAANHIQFGEADLMLCGGVEAPIIPMGLVGFSACKALSTRNSEPQKASRPWDKDRDGFVMGEGAGILLLESLEHAQKRGATILAEYLGGGASCDAHHITEPRPDGRGVESCVRQALRQANVNPDTVDYINAHATSTPAGDMAEVAAIRKIFSHPEEIVMNATKSMIGHALGASAAIEAIVTVMAIKEKLIHPTINLEYPEPGIGFTIPTVAIEKKVTVALSNSFGFGGHNASIVLGSLKK